MSGLAIAHVIAVSMWGGLVLGELVMEIAALRNTGLRYPVARFHHLIDTFVELPLLATVLATGTILLLRSHPDLHLWVKVAFGLGAVAANFGNAVVVIRRGQIAEAGADDEVISTFTRWVFRTAFVGVPMGGVALFMGGQRAGWW